MLTGQDFDLLFDQKIDKTFSGFFNPAKRNRLFREALIAAIEAKYRTLDEQKEYDELASLIRTEQKFSVNNNKIYTTDLQIVNITSIATDIRVATRLPHNLVSGDAVTISGVLDATLGTVINVTLTPTTIVNNFSFDTGLTSAGTYTTNTGVLTYDKLISDYLHLLAIKTKFTKTVNGLNITNATNQSPITITVDKENNFRGTEEFIISGVVGNTATNGTRFLKKRTSKTFTLFSDIKLTTEVAENGNYVSGGVMAKVFDNYAKPFFSDRKIAEYGKPSVDIPKVEVGDNFLKIFPDNEIASEIKIDYLSDPVVFIDVNDNVTDLELYYSRKFLSRILDEASRMFAESVRDTELFQTSTVEINQNV